MGYYRAYGTEWDRRAPLFTEESVQRLSQIRRCVCQCAIQVKKNRLDHASVSGEARMEQVIDAGVGSQFCPVQKWDIAYSSDVQNLKSCVPGP